MNFQNIAKNDFRIFVFSEAETMETDVGFLQNAYHPTVALDFTEVETK